MNKVSIIILAHNHLTHTKMCIESIKKYTTYPDYELVLVDNGSTDGTWDYFADFGKQVRVHLHKNEGVPAGFNHGIKVARGDYVCFLNNDTIVTKNWLTNMMKWYMKHSDIGVLAPRTNYACSLQRIINFPNFSEVKDIHSFSEKWCRDNKDTSFQCLRIIGMCLLIPMKIIKMIGDFDMRFGLGNFEDDDYVQRIINAGLKTLVVNDSFIYHFGSLTCKDFDFKQLLEDNEEKFREKYTVHL